eukprot:1315541-Amphidinium_carterae.3
MSSSHIVMPSFKVDDELWAEWMALFIEGIPVDSSGRTKPPSQQSRTEMKCYIDQSLLAGHRVRHYTAV